MTMQELTSAASKIVSETYSANSDVVQETLFENVKATDSYDEIYGKMFLNSVRLSVNMSVQITLSVLHELEILKPEEYREIQKSPNLTLLKFDDKD